MSVHQTATKMPFFEGHNEKGQPISSSQLAGRTLLIYFYIKDDTSICTQESCQLQSQLQVLQAKNVQVLGISPDSEASHLEFSKKYGLCFSLISDPDLTIASLFGAIEKGEEGKIKPVRATFLVDSAGRIIWKEQPVHIEGHLERIMNAIDTLKKK